MMNTMKPHLKNCGLLGIICLLGIGTVNAQTISALPSGGLTQSGDWLPAVRGGVTLKVQPFSMPASGSVLISNGTASPYGVVPVNGSCLEGVGSAWMAVPCIFSNSVTVTGSPVAGNLTQFASGNIIQPGDLSGDVTTTGTLATTVEAIDGHAVSLAGAFTTSGAHPLTLTTTGTTNVTLPTSGTLSTTTGTVTSVTFTGDGTILSSTPSSAVTGSGTVTATRANAAAHTVLGNTTGSSAAPTYTTAPVVSGKSSAGSFGPTDTTSIFGMFIGSDSGVGFSGIGSGGQDFEVNNGGDASVDWIEVAGVDSGSTLIGPTLLVQGSDTDVALRLSSKGAGHLYLSTNNMTNKGLEIDNTASTVDWLSLTGSATANPAIISLGVGAASSDTNVTIRTTAKGTGTVQSAGHIENAAGPTSSPTCGTGCSSVTAGSTDVRGSLTTSSAVSSITLNFGTTWANTPVCVVSDNSTATVLDINTISTSVLTVNTAAAVTSAKVYWICMQ